jgi:GNAT superfamily N-acetyltransferase
MPLTYRTARASDLEPAMALIIKAIEDLERRHGFEVPATDSNFANPFAAFSLEDDPSGLWVAEEDGVLQGYGFSWVSGPLWFLADLFVRPERQASGIGRSLMERTLVQADAYSTSIRALITFAYNRTSLGLYMRLGLFPLVPLYDLRGPVLAASGALDWSPIDANGNDAALLESLDRSVLGLARTKHHLYSAQNPSVSGYILKDAAGAAAGYLYLSDQGQIGPVAVRSAELMASAFGTGFAIAAARNCKNVAVMIPGPCGGALTLALSSGLRIRRPMVLLSSQPFGDWTCYAPRDAGFL